MRLPSGHRSPLLQPRLAAATALLLAAGVTASCGTTVIDRRPPTKDPTAEPTVSRTVPEKLTIPRSYGSVTLGLDCAELVELTEDVSSKALYGRALRPDLVAGAVPSTFEAVKVTWCDTADDDLALPPPALEPETRVGDPDVGVAHTSDDPIAVARVVAASREFPTEVSPDADTPCESDAEKLVELRVYLTDADGRALVVGWPTHLGSCTRDWITDPADVLAEVFGAERE